MLRSRWPALTDAHLRRLQADGVERRMNMGKR
jgi:hypothetical protein